MLQATLLALASAGLHAGWNLAAKQSRDRFLALWGQFVAAGAIGAVVLVVAGGLPAPMWAFASVTGLVHVPYVIGLATAYERGDFSVAYPIARGSGALLATVGGLLLLDDQLEWWSIVAIALVTGGICLLATSGHAVHGARVIPFALAVGVAVGIYTTNDSHAVRTYDSNLYGFAVFVMIGITVSAYGLAIGRGPDLAATMRADWGRYLATGAVVATAYILILFAVQTAPVGYVAALRESSVLIAAVLGTQMLDEGDGRKRTVAAGAIVGGLVLLIATR